jgi:hypothetical protein
MKAHEFISEEQKLDEILPLLVGAARGIAAGVGAAGRVAAPVAAAAGRVAGKIGRSAARGVVGAAGSAGRMAAGKLGAAVTQEPQVQKNPNEVVGTQSNTNIKSAATPASTTQPPTAKPAMQGNVDPAMANIKPGANLQLPTGTGKMGNFKISKVMGKNIEIENPDKNKNPNEPDKLIYNKDDLIKSMGIT